MIPFTMLYLFWIFLILKIIVQHHVFILYIIQQYEKYPIFLNYTSNIFTNLGCFQTSGNILNFAHILIKLKQLRCWENICRAKKGSKYNGTLIILYHFKKNSFQEKYSNQFQSTYDFYRWSILPSIRLSVTGIPYSVITGSYV